MKIHQIEQRMLRARDQALEALGVDAEFFDQLHLAAPPDPAMGDRGFPCFALARALRKAPGAIAEDVAQQIRSTLSEDDLICEVTTAGPYVNLRLNPSKLAQIVVGEALAQQGAFGSAQIEHAEHWMVEYSAPNTNKPQHLGHVRNNLLGAAVSKVLAFAGHQVTRVNLINDRGIHICKSMLAYELFGEGESPEASGIKGDHLVGQYYVLFERRFVDEYQGWQRTPEATARFEAWLGTPASTDAKKELGDDRAALQKRFFADYKDTYFNTDSELGAQARAMLLKWEAGDEAVVGLWQLMNSWVIDGFNQTYARLGVGFERVYYESNTYKLGKQTVLDGLDQGVFERLEGGAIVCNLEKVGLSGQKVLLRSDGTSVYMTQDLGTALQRFDAYDIDRMVYVVGDEQDYHFDVLFRVLALLKPELADHFFHLSYGMVLLPEGKMKSREGKVVDADELIDEMVALATSAIEERYAELPAAETARRAEIIGLAALKYFILDFTPRSSVQFDPQKSIDFQGRTGPYCLYSYARIQSIARKFGGWPSLDAPQSSTALAALGTELELNLIRQLQAWPRFITLAATQLDPSKITEPLFNICKAFSTMYNDPDHRIIELEGPRRDGLLLLASAVAHTLQAGLTLLGIETLDEM
ncbi:MAG: arginine--tRNA ligase [Bradymonadaceae bacterium]|nr:arginine--tRNA ligase [Lujinxingiaceae bacterium]